MNLQELSSPIRMYWDIGPSAGISPEECGRIAGEIASAKFLALQITETSSALSPSCFAALDAIKDKPLALSLVAHHAALDSSAMERLRSFPLRVLFVQISSLDELKQVAALTKLARTGTQVGPSFPVLRTNFRELPSLLTACIDGKLPHLLLPMQRLMTGVECFTFSRRERENLTDELRQIAKPSSLKITIHDPFLWRAFYPDVDFPNGGCQAANTMLYVAPDAQVYPCPTVPIAIGDLKREPLKAVISSDRKKTVRKELLAAAPACADCAGWEQCHGGCRGRAYALHAGRAGADPACQ